jgi:CRISPR-associated protein Cas1
MIICIDTYGTSISKDNNCFKISGSATDDIVKMISPLKVTAFQIYKPCNISTPAMLLAVQNNIPIVIHDGAARPIARICPSVAGNHGLIKKHQVLFGLHADGLNWMITHIALKADGQLANAKYCCNRKSDEPKILKWTQKMETLSAKFITHAPTGFEALQVQEAQVSRCYWYIVQLTLQKITAFTGREKQMATMPFNAALHYGYGMLYNTVETAVLSAGLDPQISIMHADQYNTRSFVFDAIEPFRPWIDKLVIELFMQNQLTDDCFEPYQKGGISLSKKGKAIIIPAVISYLDEKNVFNGKKIKRRDQVQFYLTRLAQYLLKQFKPS